MLLALLALGISGAQSAPLAIYTVTTTSDSGAGSLRQAILDANASPGADTIAFSIEGAGVHTIQPTMNFANLTDAVTIDGTTESDYVPGGAPRIELDGTNAGSYPAFMITAPNVTIRGLTINRYATVTAIHGTAAATSTTLEANYVGLNAAGTAAAANGTGIQLLSSGNTIGGSTAAERNVIAGNAGSALVLNGDSNAVQGNYVGTTADGLSPLGNNEGIGILGNGNTIGGPDPGEGNVLSGSLSTNGAGAGVSLNGSAANNTIEGNLIGTNKDGTAAIPNSRRGIYVQTTGANNVVRGNVISGNSGPGIHQAGDAGITIVGNRIGTDRLGTTAIPNTFGIEVSSPSTGNVIGGTTTAAANVISGNSASGIMFGNSSSNQVFGNTIGTTADGASLPNTSHGVEISFGAGNVIGGTGPGQANRIRSNGGDGVNIYAGTGHQVRGNEIDDNGGLGIDLIPDGVTPNDALDADTGANDLQNFPVLSSAAPNVVYGALDSAPDQTYTIDVYDVPTCNSSGNGEGARLVGTFSVTTNGSGTASFPSQELDVDDASGSLTATATDSAGNTSEFSACQAVSGGGGGGGGTQPGPTFTVNTTEDGSPVDSGCSDAPGDCTFREALDAADDASGVNSIVFDLPSDYQITLDSALPDITSAVSIDGANVSGPNALIDGTSAWNALVIEEGAGGSTIENLELRDFSFGIRSRSDGNTISGNSIHSISNAGIEVELGAAGNTIGGSYAAGDGNLLWNVGVGIELTSGGTGNKVQGNSVGLDGATLGTDDLAAAIAVDSTPGTVIGADVGPGGLSSALLDLGNVAVGAEPGEGGAGISVQGASAGTRITHNYVGVNRVGSATDLGNNYGIDISGSTVQIGPGNLVAHNQGPGVRIVSGSGNRIVANSIHDNSSGIELEPGANSDIGAPTLTGASEGGGGTATVAGSISGLTGSYFIEFFKNAACDGPNGGEGETYVGFASVTITEIGTSFVGTTFQGVAAGDVLTATTTRTTAPEDTSEFSNCVTVTAGGGGGGQNDPPVLFGAVAAVAANTTGIAGIVELPDDADPPLAGQQFELRFFQGATCSESNNLGLPYIVTTNDNGIAAFALEVPVDVAVGTAVHATARLVPNGDESELSNCVIADRGNTSWPTALSAPANGAVGQNYLRSSGQARWFKVPIVPNSRVDFTLSGLPADYDMVVFSDIQQAYDKMVGGDDYDPQAGPNLALDDLNRQGAEQPQDVFNTSQYNTSTWETTNYDPNLNTDEYSPSEWSPSEWSPSEWSASVWAPSEWSPSEWSPSEWSPSEWSPSEWSPSEWSPTQWSPSEWSSSNPADPRAFTAAQTASVLAVSGGPGTADERVSVNTWNNTGDFYVRVQGKNGQYVPDDAFTLTAARQPSPCTGVTDDALDSPLPVAPDGSWKTLVLLDGSRLPVTTEMRTALEAFKARPEVSGVEADVAADTVVSQLNAQADAHKGCPYAENLVATAITRIVDAYRERGIRYVVILGGDGVIPFYRYPDPALLGNENLYVPPVLDSSASQASLRLSYILNQDGYGASESISLHGNQFPVPDLPVGRLVETAGEITGMLNAYLGTTAGVTPTPTSSLVTGYDFLYDAATTVEGHLSAGIGGTNNDTLLTLPTVAPDDAAGALPNRSWTGNDLRTQLFNSGRHDLVFLAGHFSANDALAADYKTNVLSTEVPTAAANMVNTIVFSAGCHAGYNLVDGDRTQWTEPLDWAQAFARKQATLISGTGYQYGDTDFLAHSERIYAELARQLLVLTDRNGDATPDPAVPIGQALLRSKQLFLEQTPGLTALDEKALLEATLFGLPMLSVNMPSGRISETPDGTVVPGLSGVGSGPGADLGLKFANLGVFPSLTAGSKTLDGLQGPATWLSGPDGVAVRPTQPILPLESLNVTAPTSGFALRGVAFRGGTYTDESPVVPLTAAPATELRGIHAPFFTDVFFPTQPWTTSFFGALGGGSGSTFLHVTPVQHRSSSPTTRRAFGNLDLQLFYSSNTSSYCPSTGLVAPCAPGEVAVAPALAAPPTITGVETSYDSGTHELTFQARVVGDPTAGIQGVWVTWTVPPGSGGGAGSWQSLDLLQDPDDPTLWSKVLDLGGVGGPSPGAVNFVVQAVNGVGRVAMDDNVGYFYRPGSIPGEPQATPPADTTMTFDTAPPGSVKFGEEFDVTVLLKAGTSPLAGKLVRVGIGGGGGLPATTNGDGKASVTLRAALSPGTYPVTASFAGDTGFAASGASQDVAVDVRPTQLTLSGSLGTQTTNGSLQIVATLAATGSPAAPLQQRTIFVVFDGTGPANGSVAEVYTGKTDPQGKVTVPGSFLSSLPVGSYQVDAYFNGVPGELPGGVVVEPDDVDYAPAQAHETLSLQWPFAGFFVPVHDPPRVNVMKAGLAVPFRFSLGGDRGLNIFAGGHPAVTKITCPPGPFSDIGETSNEGRSLLLYVRLTKRYWYIWKTPKSYRNTCQKLTMRFVDGSERFAYFKFR